MIYVGTSGYSYKDWIGPFYPEGTKDSSMLGFYSREFNFVEVNSSYYHMPGRRLFESIDSKTPEGFKAAVKLYKGFTHERNKDFEEAEKFKYSIEPLIQSGKLVTLLAQFPYSFHFNQDNMDYLKRLREWFYDIEINVEFRNQNWIRQEVMNLLKNENLGFVCVDEPDIKGLIRKVIVATSKVSYLRLHGRNAGKWYEGEGAERYDYLYDNKELVEWVPRIKELEGSSLVSVVAFNNHPQGKAAMNAKTMMGLLRE